MCISGDIEIPENKSITVGGKGYVYSTTDNNFSNNTTTFTDTSRVYFNGTTFINSLETLCVTNTNNISYDALNKIKDDTGEIVRYAITPSNVVTYAINNTIFLNNITKTYYDKTRNLLKLYTPHYILKMNDSTYGDIYILVTSTLVSTTDTTSRLNNIYTLENGSYQKVDYISGIFFEPVYMGTWLKRFYDGLTKLSQESLNTKNNYYFLTAYKGSIVDHLYIPISELFTNNIDDDGYLPAIIPHITTSSDKITSYMKLF
jgi:hypothetical protein